MQKHSSPIWKFYGKKDEETGEETEGRCHPKKAFWFTFDQVEDETLDTLEKFLREEVK